MAFDEIIQGWKKFAEGYEPTPLTPEEELAMDRIMLAASIKVKLSPAKK